MRNASLPRPPEGIPKVRLASNILAMCTRNSARPATLGTCWQKALSLIADDEVMKRRLQAKLDSK